MWLHVLKAPRMSLEAELVIRVTGRRPHVCAGISENSGHLIKLSKGHISEILNERLQYIWPQSMLTCVTHKLKAVTVGKYDDVRFLIVIMSNSWHVFAMEALNLYCIHPSVMCHPQQPMIWRRF